VRRSSDSGTSVVCGCDDDRAERTVSMNRGGGLKVETQCFPNGYSQDARVRPSERR